MSKNLEPNFDFTIGGSRNLRRVVSIVHGLGLLACWINDLPLSVSCGLTVMVSVGWWRHLESYGTESLHLRYTPCVGWFVLYTDVGYVPITIQPSTVVTRFLIALHWKFGSQDNRNVLISNDAMSSTDYRRLSVCLIISGQGND